MSRHIEIFTDMDEVGVNLSKIVIEHYNKDYKDNFNYKDNKSYLWGDVGASRDYFEDVLRREGLFLNAEPIKGFIEAMTKLHNDGFKIKVCTLPVWDSLYSHREKNLWLEKYLPFINIRDDVIMTNSKFLLAKPNRILYDDNPDHLFKWRDNGGIAVAFKQHWNEGFEVRKTHQDFCDYIWQCEKNNIRQKKYIVDKSIKER